jgi:hypothetical protein
MELIELILSYVIMTIAIALFIFVMMILIPFSVMRVGQLIDLIEAKIISGLNSFRNNKNKEEI